MADANQVWDVPQAIERIAPPRAVRAPVDRGADEPRRRASVHAAIRRRRSPRSAVATGEHAAKPRGVQATALQAEAIDYLPDRRVAGWAASTKVLAVLLLAAKFGVPVCPATPGGLGLCELRPAPERHRLRVRERLTR